MTLQKLKALYDTRALKFWNIDTVKVQEVSRVCNYQHKHVKTTKKVKKEKLKSTEVNIQIHSHLYICEYFIYIQKNLGKNHNSC